MLYLVSDIHGNLKDFQELLCKIDFSGDRDHMIILGICSIGSRTVSRY